MDLVWLVIPAAAGSFALRAYLIARRLKAAARRPLPAEVRAFRDARGDLEAHREPLQEARAAVQEHLRAAKDASRLIPARSRTPSTGIDAMVEDFLPERRL